MYSTILLLSTTMPLSVFAETATNESTNSTTEIVTTNDTVEATETSDTSETINDTPISSDRTEPTTPTSQLESTSEATKTTETTSTNDSQSTVSSSMSETSDKKTNEQPKKTVVPKNEQPSVPSNTPEIATAVSNNQEVIVNEQPPTYTEPALSMAIPDSPETIHFEKVKTTEDFVKQVGESARNVAKDNDLFASVMIAQAILESGSGSSELSREPNYNLFGIKGEFKGQSVSFLTAEDNGTGQLYSIQSNFRKYPSYKESFEDYATLLKDGVSWNTAIYHGTHKSVAKTYENATKALTGTYATDIQYNKKLNGLIETYHLTEYDQEKTSTPIESDFPKYNGVNYDKGNSYAWGNCTQYVYNRITQLGKHVDLTMGNGQDWDETGRVRGYNVTNTPKAGMAASFPAGVLGSDPTYGHVAFVEKVFKDGSILISEMNVKGLNVVSTRTISAKDISLLSYVQPK
ncbi:glucosaminidase domain-containing protein [Enterococcus faecalis]|uniref:glucosaminidase domain-containing protein n=1 Tax=Enterococcus faecalis TaxID=1351 RepID=UPI003860237B